MEEKAQALIVEDDTFIADIMTSRFETSFDVRRVDSIASARELLEKYPIKVLFLDIHLPDESGVDFLKELQACGQIQNYIVIVLSNESSDEEIQACMDAGATRYYVKAIADFGEIAEEVKTLL